MEDNKTKTIELVEGVDKLLSKIPGDGSKTAVGAAILAALPHLVEAFPAILAVSPYLNMVGLALALIGLAHKPLKAILAKADQLSTLARDGKPGVRSAEQD